MLQGIVGLQRFDQKRALMAATETCVLRPRQRLGRGQLFAGFEVSINCRFCVSTEANRLRSCGGIARYSRARFSRRGGWRFIRQSPRDWRVGGQMKVAIYARGSTLEQHHSQR
jgi:hypothetical protein